jgi:hypothetical protein
VRRLFKAWFLVGLGLGAGAAHAKHARDLWSVGTARELLSRGDAKSLATAAILLQSANALAANGGLHAIDAADRAALEAPDDHAIGWIRLRICEQTPGCDLPGVATTLRWVDADNAAPWVSMLSAAIHDKDEQAADRALAGMAGAKRFYLYWNPTVTMVFDALKGAGARAPPGMSNADHSRLDAAYGISTLVLPPLRPVPEACKDARPASRRHEPCARIAALLQRGDAVVSQMEGYAIQKRLFPVDSKDARIAAEHQKTLESRMRAERKFETAFLPWFNNRLAVHRLALMRQFAREEDVMNAVLREHHVNGDAPHD